VMGAKIVLSEFSIHNFPQKSVSLVAVSMVEATRYVYRSFYLPPLISFFFTILYKISLVL
jgi:hypothetical protein